MLSLRTELDLESQPLHKEQNNNWIQLIIMQQQWGSKLLSSNISLRSCSPLSFSLKFKKDKNLCAANFPIISFLFSSCHFVMLQQKVQFHIFTMSNIMRAFLIPRQDLYSYQNCHFAYIGPIHIRAAWKEQCKTVAKERLSIAGPCF